MNVIQEGLSLSAIGLVVAFLFMSIFILVIVILQKLFPADQVKETVTDMSTESTEEIPEKASDDGAIAAIAVAMTLARSAMGSSLGASLEEGRSTWWIANRMNAQQDAGLQKFRRGTA